MTSHHTKGPGDHNTNVSNVPGSHAASVKWSNPLTLGRKLTPGSPFLEVGRELWVYCCGKGCKIILPVPCTVQGQVSFFISKLEAPPLDQALVSMLHLYVLSTLRGPRVYSCNPVCDPLISLRGVTLISLGQGSGRQVFRSLFFQKLPKFVFPETSEVERPFSTFPVSKENCPVLTRKFVFHSESEDWGGTTIYCHWER